jgi:hypothetical protein
MAGRGPQTFKKRQKEQQRKEKQQEKIAKRLQRRQEKPDSTLDSDGIEWPTEDTAEAGISDDGINPVRRPDPTSGAPEPELQHQQK